MLEKIQILERDASGDKGPFSLFGLFLREGSPNRWDLVAAAPWSADGRELLNYLSGRLTRSLNTDELVLVSRIVPLSQDDRFLQAVLGAVTVEHGVHEVASLELAGIDIARAFIITSRLPSGRVQSRIARV